MKMHTRRFGAWPKRRYKKQNNLANSRLSPRTPVGSQCGLGVAVFAAATTQEVDEEPEVFG